MDGITDAVVTEIVKGAQRPSLSQVVQWFLLYPGKWPGHPETGLSTQHINRPP